MAKFFNASGFAAGGWGGAGGPGRVNAGLALCQPSGASSHKCQVGHVKPAENFEREDCGFEFRDDQSDARNHKQCLARVTQVDAPQRAHACLDALRVRDAEKHERVGAGRQNDDCRRNGEGQQL